MTVSACPPTKEPSWKTIGKVLCWVPVSKSIFSKNRLLSISRYRHKPHTLLLVPKLCLFAIITIMLREYLPAIGRYWNVHSSIQKLCLKYSICLFTKKWHYLRGWHSNEMKSFVHVAYVHPACNLGENMNRSAKAVPKLRQRWKNSRCRQKIRKRSPSKTYEIELLHKHLGLWQRLVIALFRSRCKCKILNLSTVKMEETRSCSSLRLTVVQIMIQQTMQQPIQTRALMLSQMATLMVYGLVVLAQDRVQRTLLPGGMTYVLPRKKNAHSIAGQAVVASAFAKTVSYQTPPIQVTVSSVYNQTMQQTR